jgi:hypothetical protein
MKYIFPFVLIILLSACTRTYSPTIPLGEDRRELLPLSRDEYELTQANYSGVGGGWKFFWGLLGGTSQEEVTYDITKENNIDGLMLTRMKEDYPWYSVVLGAVTYGLVFYHEIEVTGIGIVVKRDN